MQALRPDCTARGAAYVDNLRRGRELLAAATTHAASRGGKNRSKRFVRVLWAIAAAVGVGFFCRRARRWRTICRAVRRFLNLLRRATGYVNAVLRQLLCSNSLGVDASVRDALVVGRADAAEAQTGTGSEAGVAAGAAIERGNAAGSDEMIESDDKRPNS